MTIQHEDLAARNAAHEAWNGPWNPQLQCCLNGTYADRKNKTVYLRIGTGHCVDMSGAIDLSKGLLPDVDTVITICRGASPGCLDVPDTAYQLDECGEWFSIHHTTVQDRLSPEHIRSLMQVAWTEVGADAPRMTAETESA